MRAAVELRDLTHYPFLKEAQGVLASRGIKVQGLSGSALGKKYLDKAAERVCYAIDGKNDYPEDKEDRVSDIITYVLARVLVSCAKDKRTIERFCKMEARRVYGYLKVEENEALKDKVNEELGISFGSGNLQVLRYVELSSNVRDSKWRLINREVDSGFVKITDDEKDLLVGERIRFVLSSSLPMDVPGSIEKEFLPWSDKIIAKVQERTLSEFGTIDESAYPPCIQALIAGAAAGLNLTHSGRFSLVAFLHNIGMSSEQIEGIFSRSPDYNPDMTGYQVNHIFTNEYTSPSCATMLTHGVCVNKDRFCEKSVHPLNYYRSKKKFLEKKKLLDESKSKSDSTQP
ncbi:MAG: DNA primase large subunit PriL [Methanocorpusculum sp.]|nr:DNA primase large subunit PriL [Methanocorpusculum sp.]